MYYMTDDISAFAWFWFFGYSFFTAFLWPKSTFSLDEFQTPTQVPLFAAFFLFAAI